MVCIKTVFRINNQFESIKIDSVLTRMTFIAIIMFYLIDRYCIYRIIGNAHIAAVFIII